jgi:hypothetical protein
MNVYIVTANAGDRSDYSDFCIPDGRIHPWSWRRTMAEYLYRGYAEEVSIMGVYSTRDQAENRVRELDREHFDKLQIFECVVDANCWKYVGGYEE